MARKLHPADIRDRARIASAREFSVYQYRHRNQYRRYGFTSLADAAAHAEEVELEHTWRPAIIYAIVDGVSIPVPPDLRDQARRP